MSFLSLHFVVFFVVVFLVTNLLGTDNTRRKLFLLVASYYFYMLWDWRFAGLLLFLTACNFILGARIHNASTLTFRRLYLAASLVLSLGVLACFKYANFFIDSVNTVLSTVGFTGELPMLSVLLPVGISFYTFQSITYSLDIYRRDMEPVKSPLDFAVFVAFFPQLVAGPIVRAHYFLPQLARVPLVDSGYIESGFALMLRGFIKKVVFADVLAVHFVDPAFASPGQYAPGFLLLALYAYTFQIYMDFSGYTDIARGIARTLGYELPENFDRPYKAPSVSNFWQRWHMSMSSFFRDYLFFGLGGSRHGNVYVNVVITFLAIGMWHGAGWNFALYGLLHGSVVALERWRRNRRRARGLPDADPRGWSLVMNVFLVFQFVAFARILFRGGSIEGGVDYARAMLDFSTTLAPLSGLGVTALVVAALLHYTPSHWSRGWVSVYTRLPWPAQSCAVVVAIYALVALAPGQAPFIYFQF